MQVCKSPFLIWFTGRSGSTYLCDLLNSHSDIYCRREDFSEIRIESENSQSMPSVDINGTRFVRRLHRPQGDLEHPSRGEAIDYLNQLFSKDCSACGFKMKYPNQFLVFPEIAHALKETPNIRLVGLRRENVLKQAISLGNVDRLHQMGVVNSGNAKCDVNLEPLCLDVDETLKNAMFFAKCKSHLERFASEFNKVHFVVYEDLCYRPQKTLDELLKFLDVDGNAEYLQSRFKKITPDRISDAVSNYDQLEQAVAGTELEIFLD